VQVVILFLFKAKSYRYFFKGKKQTAAAARGYQGKAREKVPVADRLTRRLNAKPLQHHAEQDDQRQHHARDMR
jgi:hypothetical protein